MSSAVAKRAESNREANKHKYNRIAIVIATQLQSQFKLISEAIERKQENKYKKYRKENRNRKQAERESKQK
jgi:hypothetical protein